MRGGLTGDHDVTQVIDIKDLDWADLVPGVQAKRVWTDLATKRQALFLRFAAGATLDRHVHEGDELVYVLEGGLADDVGVIAAGNVGYRSPGCIHAVCSPRGATALAVITGDVRPIEDQRTGESTSFVYDLAATRWTQHGPELSTKTVWADGVIERAATLTRWAPGALLPTHRHAGDELVFVIEGTVEDEACVLRPGVVGYRPNGCVHTVRSPYGATSLSFLWGSVESA